MKLIRDTIQNVDKDEKAYFRLDASCRDIWKSLI